MSLSGDKENEKKNHLKWKSFKPMESEFAFFFVQHKMKILLEFNLNCEFYSFNTEY